MNIPTPTCFRNIRIVASNSKPAMVLPILGKLMPYATAAKAIFIRANGEAAYYKTTGIAREANDPIAAPVYTPLHVIREN